MSLAAIQLTTMLSHQVKSQMNEAKSRLQSARGLLAPSLPHESVLMAPSWSRDRSLGHRRDENSGQRFDVREQTCDTCLLVPILLRTAWKGEVPVENGLRNQGALPHGSLTAREVFTGRFGCLEK